ncbi:hypothetical protein GGI21_006673, partial [Coemansia aciculifera]
MTSSQAASKQADIEQLTRELKTHGKEGGGGGGGALELLLQRARLYADLGDADKAKADISQAAALSREEGGDAASASVAAVERAFREISVASSSTRSGAGKYTAYTTEDIVSKVVAYVDGPKSGADEATEGVVEGMRVVGSRIAGSKTAQLADEQLVQLVDGFHSLCKYDKLSKEHVACAAAAIADTVRSALSQSAAPTANEPAAAISTLVFVASRIATSWDENQGNSGFKHQA